jgi:hypothetical protein
MRCSRRARPSWEPPSRRIGRRWRKPRWPAIGRRWRPRRGRTARIEQDRNLFLVRTGFTLAGGTCRPARENGSGCTPVVSRPRSSSPEIVRPDEPRTRSGFRVILRVTSSETGPAGGRMSRHARAPRRQIMAFARLEQRAVHGEVLVGHQPRVVCSGSCRRASRACTRTSSGAYPDVWFHCRVPSVEP